MLSPPYIVPHSRHSGYTQGMDVYCMLSTVIHIYLSKPLDPMALYRLLCLLENYVGL